MNTYITEETLRNLPIGVYDSGLGGLTVYRELKKALPGEQFLYFGDNAHLPYGSKSEENIKRFAFESAFFLASKGIKLLVVACNTVSSIALPNLVNSLRFPVIGVVQAGVESVCQRENQKRIAVIGTGRTIKSEAYQSLIRERLDVEIIARSCPLFVPIIEEGLVDTVILAETISQYLEPIRQQQPDSLILGCTHYPLIEDKISQFFGKEVHVVNSARAVAHMVQKELDQGLARTEKPAEDEFYLSDKQENFQKIAHNFLGFSIPNVRIERNLLV